MDIVEINTWDNSGELFYLNIVCWGNNYTRWIFLGEGEGLFSLMVSFGLALLFAFRSEPSGNGRKSMGAVRAFFFLALVSKNRAPLIQLPPVNAGFLKLCRRCLPYLRRKVRVLLYGKVKA